jgi:hypothetical protein
MTTAFSCALLPAFQEHLATLAEADWHQVIGARDAFINLPPDGKDALNTLCQASSPSAAELMAALAAATHSR